MLKKWIAACLLAGAAPALTPAWAQGAVCTEPAPPGPINGATTMQQIVALRTQVVAFRDQSDVYQTCIASDLEAKTKAATPAAPLDPGVRQVALAKVAASQAAKEKAIAELNALIKVYRGAHPR
ncbi:MAG TPA: hypothetical protein VJ798_05680 [Rhizomicrobium sp.]|nr:hypothetical protein [Rhizomicrobium sp.]